MYSWTLKTSENSWSNFSWSFTSFKHKWKKAFFNEYKKIYWINFREDVPNPKIRQAIYETLLWVRWTWVFNKIIPNYSKIEEEQIERAKKIDDLLKNRPNT